MALKMKYSPLQHFTLNNVFTAFTELSPRNKLVALGIISIVLILILFLPLSLFSAKVDSLRREISTARRGFRQVETKIAEYQKSKAEIEALESRFNRVSGGSLTSRVENAAKQAGLTVDQLREKPPQESDVMEISSIEVKLANISLSQLIDFLQGLEGDPSSSMRVRRIQIKPKYNNRQILDVSFELANFSIKKEG